MIAKLKHALLTACLLAGLGAVAQESMIPDVSAAYMDTLVALAKKNYPRVKVFEHNEAKAKAGIQRAALSWFDIFTFTYLTSSNQGTTTLVNPTVTSGYQYGVYFNLGNLAVKPAGVRVAREEYRAAQESSNEYMLNLETEVKRRYFTYLKELAVLRLRLKSTVDVESTTKQLMYRFEKGEVTIVDYNSQLTNFNNAIQAKIEAETAVLIAKSSIEELIGVKLETVK